MSDCPHDECESEACYYTDSHKPSWLRQKFLLTYKTADVTFVVGKDKKEVPAYKTLLSFANIVFREMFGGKFNGTEEGIEISEFEAEDFKLFLEFLYFDEIDFTKCNPVEIYMIAHKYMVKSLCDDAVTEIISRVNSKSVFETMEWNQTYNELRIESKVNELFTEN